MRLASAVAAVGVLLLAGLSADARPKGRAYDAQVSSQPQLEFEVASVKTSHSNLPGGIIGIRAYGWDATNETLRQLIMAAYGVESFRIIGGPAWMASDRFDIQARTTVGATREQLMAMLQALLAKRFHLIAKKETRELPIYELVVDSPNPKPGLRSAVPDACTDRGDLLAGPPTGSLPSCGALSAGPGKMSGRSIPMTLLATILGPRVGRPVVDRTGRTAKFDIDLSWTPEDQQAPAGGAVTPSGVTVTMPDGPPAIFTAVQEQLGLKLRSAQGPVEVVVISSVEHPTEN